MTTQPRLKAGARQAGAAVGGQYTHKTVPDVKADDLGFNAGAVVEPPKNDWSELDVRSSGLRTVFNRTVETDTNGDEVVSVTTNCEPPDMMLLARKGDEAYWNSNVWSKQSKDRRLWSADITRQMLEEGFVATIDGSRSGGVHTAMRAASSPKAAGWESSPNVLTGVVAQIRGLRLVQSMNPADGWNAKFGGHTLRFVDRLLYRGFVDVYAAYNQLPKPPWEPDGVPWGPQEVAGYATGTGGDVFVGENGDLLWRALTETDYHGMSPLKEVLAESNTKRTSRYVSRRSTDMIVAAALYDETAEQQLTTGLYDGLNAEQRVDARTNTLRILTEALNPTDQIECRWTPEQQQRLQSFYSLIY